MESIFFFRPPRVRVYRCEGVRINLLFSPLIVFPPRPPLPLRRDWIFWIFFCEQSTQQKKQTVTTLTRTREWVESRQKHFAVGKIITCEAACWRHSLVLDTRGPRHQLLRALLLERDTLLFRREKEVKVRRRARAEKNWRRLQSRCIGRFYASVRLENNDRYCHHRHHHHRRRKTPPLPSIRERFHFVSARCSQITFEKRFALPPAETTKSTKTK